jgi:uncharacterized membrane protein
MKTVRIALSGFAAGAAVMYFSDPARGRRRRARVRDRSVRVSRRFLNLLNKAKRDTANRARGSACAVRAAFRDGRTLDDIVVERVRAKLGRLVSHPHAIDVSCSEGRVTLGGPVLKLEEFHLVRCVRAIPGVVTVENKLDPHDSSENIPRLQGEPRRQTRAEGPQQPWTPGLRVAAGTLGGLLLSYGISSKGARAFASEVAGAALLGRAISNRGIRNLIGLGNGAHCVELHKTICIQAPAEEIFGYFSDASKLPRFMAHLKEVRNLGGGKFHWTAEGPAGIPVSWDAEVTESISNKLVAWRSVPGSTVETEGVVRFEPHGNGGTRVTIHMTYKPPAGVLGHCITALFGANPKSEIDDDMVRLKSLMERGSTSAHGAKVDKKSLGLRGTQPA